MMDRLGSSKMTHRCGHPLSSVPAIEQHEAYLIRAAFPCQHCLCEMARKQALDTHAYVNLQQLSPGMAAFVVEVTRTSDELGDLLAAVGYAKRGRSRDELTPGELASGAADEVWRKEFWFATSTDPQHVISLVDHIKLEMSWLGEYLPGGVTSIDFCSFPS
ncbi:hypothetical protein [Chitinolyticbacter albus]|uniref:hypothetical protein n=1 Tax=Chitinolyticbacter albus TaxID=2961951 RepID=UPI00210D54F4|nr:hypothetical protein [Chitinolyticbacter albus]